MGIKTTTKMKCDVCGAEHEYEETERNESTGWKQIEVSKITTRFTSQEEVAYICPAHDAVRITLRAHTRSGAVNDIGHVEDIEPRPAEAGG